MYMYFIPDFWTFDLCKSPKTNNKTCLNELVDKSNDDDWEPFRLTRVHIFNIL